MTKLIKIILIIVIAIIVVSAGYFLWQYLINSKTLPFATTLNQTESPELQNNSKLSALTSEPIFSFWINKKSGELFYVTQDGQIWELADNKTKQTVSSQNIPNLNDVRPSLSGGAVLISFGYPQAPSFSVFDLNKKGFVPLPKGATAAVWDPKSDNRILYSKENGASGQINILNLITGNSSEILRINQKDMGLEWNHPDVIYLTEKFSDKTPGSLWSFNLLTKALKNIIKEESGGVMTKWSKDGSWALRLSAGKLAITNSQNKILSALGFNTLPSKCTFDGQRAYCAVPARQPGDALFFDRLTKGDDQVTDNLLIIPLVDLHQGELLPELVLFNSFVSRTSINAINLEAWKGKLFFINKKDGLLYSIPL